MNIIKIALVDDHQMFRDGVKSILHDEKEIEIVGEVGKGSDLITLLESVKPDMIITDISIPDISGIELTKYVSEKYPEIKILILSMHMKEEFVIKSLEAGASGYLTKDTSMKDLLEAIYAIHRGENYFNKEISDTLVRSLIKKAREKKSDSKNDSLTRREIEVITNVVDGLSNKEIAEKLFISVRTVDSHKSNIMQKLNLKSSVDLVKYAIKNNLAKLD